MRNLRPYRFFTLLCLLAFFAGSGAWADGGDEHPFYVSGHGGLFIPFNNNESAQLGYGGGVGYRLSRFWTVGAYVFHSSQTVRVLTFSTNVNNSLYGGEIMYSIDTWNEFPWLKFGFTLGLLSQDYGANATILGLPVAGSSSALDYMMGVKLACEYKFPFGLSLGGELDSYYDIPQSIASPLVLMTTIRVWF